MKYSLIDIICLESVGQGADVDGGGGCVRGGRGLQIESEVLNNLE